MNCKKLEVPGQDMESYDAARVTALDTMAFKYDILITGEGSPE